MIDLMVGVFYLIFKVAIFVGCILIGAFVAGIPGTIVGAVVGVAMLTEL